MSKYLYTPGDIALYFGVSDLTVSEEKKIRDAIWEERDLILHPYYRKDKYKYVKEIYKLLSSYEDENFYSEMQEINKVLKEIGSNYTIKEDCEDQQYIEAFFRYIKLRLTYTPKVSYVNLKLRTLLWDFGYKRRTSHLIDNISRTLKALKLETYLRNYEKCNIADIKLDDMIMIRLK